MMLIQTLVEKILRKARSIRDRIRDQRLAAQHPNRLFTGGEIASVIQRNRRTLAKVPRWVDDDVYRKSVFQYGLPENTKRLIDLPIDAEVTYTDVICFLQSR